MKIRPIFLCSVSFLFISCGVSQRNSSVQDQDVGDVSTGYLATSDGYVKINYFVEDGQALFGGDMLLPQSQILTDINSSSLGLARESAATKLWPNKRVPYALPAKFPFSAELQHAISEWNKAGVSWVPKNASDTDYVQFELDEFANYCGQSVVGRVGGAQKLRLPSGLLAAKLTCKMKHVLLHEMAHALGFMHEHQRPDRDSFVKFEGSIASNYWLRKIEGSIPETPFDIESVTMYGSENTVPRMVTPDGKLIPLRNVLSTRDIEGVKKIYSASSVTTSNNLPKRCLIVGGAGKVLHDKSQQRTECIAACKSFETKNPKRSCTFGNEKLK